MKDNKIFVAGHNGMVGSTIMRLLKKKNFEIITRERKELDLTNQHQVRRFFQKENISQVYLAAARVGGIYANNTFRAEFIYENLMIQTNIIHSAFLSNVRKLLFLGSSCIYPKNANQPMKEEELLTGKLELTNEPYAVAKIAGIKMCESYNDQYGKSHKLDYRSIMPTNLYGPGDNFHPQNSHVIPGLIYRFHKAKVNNSPKVKIWGSGEAKREFLHVEDMARASVYLMNLKQEKYKQYTSSSCSHINVGSGHDIKIKKLAEIIKKVVDFKGKIVFDQTKPDGPPRKLLDIRRITKLGFKPKISLEEGLVNTYRKYLKTL